MNLISILTLGLLQTDSIIITIPFYIALMMLIARVENNTSKPSKLARKLGEGINKLAISTNITKKTWKFIKLWIFYYLSLFMNILNELFNSLLGKPNLKELSSDLLIRNVELEDKNNNLSKTNDSLKDDIKKLSENNNYLKDEIGKLKSNFNKMEEIKEEFESRFMVLTREFESFKNKNKLEKEVKVIDMELNKTLDDILDEMESNSIKEIDSDEESLNNLCYN